MDKNDESRKTPYEGLCSWLALRSLPLEAAPTRHGESSNWPERVDLSAPEGFSETRKLTDPDAKKRKEIKMPLVPWALPLVPWRTYHT